MISVQGPNNENVNKMLAAYPGVRINIPPLSVMKDDLSIVGEKEGVLAIKDQVTKIWKEMERKCTSVSIEVKKSQHRYNTIFECRLSDPSKYDICLLVRLPSFDKILSIIIKSYY